MATDRIVYGENTRASSAGIIMLLTSAAGLTVGAVGFPAHWAALLFVISLTTIFVGLVALSMGIYYLIILTPETLRVGRDRIAIADIDPDFGAKEAASGAGELAWSRQEGEPVLLGGAYGKLMGSSVVTISVRGKSKYISSRNPQGLSVALKKLLKVR